MRPEDLQRLQAQADADMRERLRHDQKRRNFYASCAIVAAVAVVFVFVLYWSQMSWLVRAGTALSALSAGLLLAWLLMDLREDVLECPRWLRLGIVWSTVASVVCFVAGYALR